MDNTTALPVLIKSKYHIIYHIIYRILYNIFYHIIYDIG
nr:MAG TPA_asm: hypothetical protein [Caudoviricetes sp.]